MCPVVAPVARVMGNNAIKVIDANLGASGNRSPVQIGDSLGMIATGFILLTILSVIDFAIADLGSA